MAIQMKDKEYIKYVSLVVLTCQNALLSLSMRYARTRPGDMFISSTAVVMTEVSKLFLSMFLVYYMDRVSVSHCLKSLYYSTLLQPLEALRICVPSLAYIVQNNLLYVAASNLDAATVQVTYQLKILTTAIFAVCLLRRSLGPHQWLALILLICGIALVQVADVRDQAQLNSLQQNRFLGFASALSACVLSGFAGIYFEKILKGAEVSLWMRNVQLATLSIPLGLVHAFAKDGIAILDHGFFYGYGFFVIYVVLLQAGGGLLVSVVVKYADNILKGFATSFAIILSCIVSIYLFDFVINFKFVLGAALVIVSIFLYGMPGSIPQKILQNQIVEKV